MSPVGIPNPKSAVFMLSYFALFSQIALETCAVDEAIKLFRAGLTHDASGNTAA